PFPISSSLSAACAVCPTLSLAESHDGLLSFAMPSNCSQLYAPRRPGASSAVVLPRWLTAGALGCDKKVRKDDLLDCATATQQGVVAILILFARRVHFAVLLRW